jgi:hypothetical protein
MALILIVGSCKIDDFSEEVATGANNPAPTLTLVSPTDTLRVSLARDQIIPVVSEIFDETPALSIYGVRLADSTGRVVFAREIPIQGTSRTAQINLADSLLEIGQQYTMNVYTEDTEGSRTEVENSLIGIGLLSVQDEMYILGSFNGWGGTDNQMELVADYTWREVFTLTATDEFKFVNTPDFSDVDWEDPECDFQATVDGPGNIACGFEGTYECTFNDLTLQYTMRQLAQNQAEMFILASFNGWGGTDNQMNLIDDNLWQDTDVNMVDGDEFKFANTSNFSGLDWGDGGCDGSAEEFGSNIACGFDGSFTVQFNDATLEYVVIPQ